MHWGLIKARIEFKVCLMTFKALKFGEPSNLTDDFSYLDPDTNTNLRSADDPHL